MAKREGRLELTDKTAGRDIRPVGNSMAARTRVIGAYLSRGWVALCRFAWVPVSFVCLLLSYLLVWQRGFYFDDYNNRFLAYNVVTGHYLPIWSRGRYGSFPARMLSWTIVVWVQYVRYGWMPKRSTRNSTGVRIPRA